MRLPEACRDEEAAVLFLESLRWRHAPECPRCESGGVYRMRSLATGARHAGNRWRCRACNRQYTVRTGTVMEDSRVPLRVWCLAYYRACNSKGGVTAQRVAREGGISIKSALFLMERIRWALCPEPTEEDQ